MAVIDELRRKVWDSGQPQSKVASTAGLDPTHVCRLMNPKRATPGISVKSLEKIANAVGYDVVLKRREQGVQWP